MRYICILLFLCLMPHTAWASKKIIVCVPSSNPPFAFIDKEDNLQGFDLEILENMQLPYDLDLQRRDFASSIAGLSTNECDMILSNVTITDKRKKHVLFTNPHIDTGLYAAVTKDSPITDIENIEYSIIGVLKGSVAEKFAFSNFKGGIIYAMSDNELLLEMLNEGTIEAVLENLPYLQTILKGNNLRILKPYLFQEQLAYAVSMDNEQLRDSINVALEKMQNDGSFNEIYEKWFGPINIDETEND